MKLLSCPTKDSLIKIAALVAFFWLLPALTMLIPDSTSLIIALLLLLFPLLTLALALHDGATHGLSIWWLLAPTVGFLTTVFVFYNESALVYTIAYAVIGCIGNSIGSLIRLFMR